jgi:VIT1/CCC1 family predicted Fe2+/Mn2+ transporter
MSDPFTGARAPDTEPYATTTYPETAYPAETYPAETYPAGGQGSTGDQSAVKQAAGQSAQAAGQAAGQVKDTAKEQALRVGSEAKSQVRNVASEVRGKVSDQARNQNDKLVGGIRQMADHLDEMRGDRQDSPATQIVSRVADSGRQLAGYLETNGPEGVLREVEDFARRRPGAFLATALAAGFVVARLGKGVAKADDLTSDKPASDSFVSNPGTYDTGYTTPATTGYTTGTTGYVDPAVTTTSGYPAATTEYASTGTGTPVVVEEDYVTGTTRDYPGGTR